MVDRYDDAVRALREVPAPDQWMDIESRALTPGNSDAKLVSLDVERSWRRPSWPVLTAAVAMLTLMVLGVTNLFSQGTAHVTEVDPTSIPEHDDGDVAAPPRHTTSTSTATTQRQAREEAEPEVEHDAEDRGEAVTPPPPPPEEETSTSSSTTLPAETMIASCQDLQLTSTDGPADLDETQQTPTPNDPRVHEAAWPRLIGVFDSTSRTDRAVFVVTGFGFGEDGGRRIDVPEPIETAWIAYAPDQGIVEFSIGPDTNLCEITLLANGLDEQELVQFVQGLERAQ